MSAHGAAKDPHNKCEPIPVRDLLKRRDLLIFLASVILFHFGNAAMLPMAGQVLALAHPGEDTIALSACIIAAQLVMVGVAWAVGRAAARGCRAQGDLPPWRSPCCRCGACCSPSRRARTTSLRSSCSTAWRRGFSGWSYPHRVRPHARHGALNLTQGLVALSVGIGAGLSNGTAA
jgi:hypothetical protein